MSPQSSALEIRETKCESESTMPPKLDQRVVIALADDDVDVQQHTSDTSKSTHVTAQSPAPTAPSKTTTQESSGEASLTARYTCASFVVAILAVWGKFTFAVDGIPGRTTPMHSWTVPFLMNIFYLVSLEVLRIFSSKYLSKMVDVKSLLNESMLVYNVAQVVLNGWMVYAIIMAIMFDGHPFIAGGRDVTTRASFVVWAHYCNKYLEYLDTYFMVLRGRMDQVSENHISSGSALFCVPLGALSPLLIIICWCWDNTGLISSRIPSHYNFHCMVGCFEFLRRK